MNKSSLKKIISEGIRSNSQLKENIKKIYLFGSYLYGNARQDSDVDLLIEFNPTARIGFFNFLEIQEKIEKFIGKHVDLLTPEGLSRYFKDEVLRQAEVIYEG